jgi:hypothetical protein
VITHSRVIYDARQAVSNGILAEEFGGGIWRRNLAEGGDGAHLAFVEPASCLDWGEERRLFKMQPGGKKSSEESSRQTQDATREKAEKTGG